MGGEQPLYRQTEADESWWPEGSHAEFRYGWPWRTWSRNAAVIAGIVLVLTGLPELLGEGDLSLGLSFGFFMLLFIGAFYAPFFLVFQVTRPRFTYLRVGPKGIEWRDDLLGERRFGGDPDGTYVISAILGFRPRRLRWEDTLCVVVPRATAGERTIRITHAGPASPAVINADGLKKQDTLFAVICRKSGMRDALALPEMKARRAAVFALDRARIYLEDPEEEFEPRMASDPEAVLHEWDMTDIRRDYQIACCSQERLDEAEERWLDGRVLSRGREGSNDKD